mgnify:CR=1 FL=1
MEAYITFLISDKCGRTQRAVIVQAEYFFVRVRSEEHTSELQSRSDLVCRLLLEKKKQTVHQTATKDEI